MGRGDFPLSWNDANASRSTADVENKNNPGMILVGIRFTDKKAPSPCWRKPNPITPVPHVSKNLTVHSDHKGNGPPLLMPSSFGAAGRNSGGEAVFVELLIAAAALRV